MAPKILEFIEWHTVTKSLTVPELDYLHKSRCGSRVHSDRADKQRCVAVIFTKQERLLHNRISVKA